MYRSPDKATPIMKESRKLSSKEMVISSKVPPNGQPTIFKDSSEHQHRQIKPIEVQEKLVSQMNYYNVFKDKSLKQEHQASMAVQQTSGTGPDSNVLTKQLVRGGKDTPFGFGKSFQISTNGGVTKLVEQ